MTDDLREYHEALNGLWVAFGREFRENVDLFVVRQMIDRLLRGQRDYGFPVSAGIPDTPITTPDKAAEEA